MKRADKLSSRDRIIEAAIALMRGSGLSGAGINDIVQESGAPKGSMYHYFPRGKLQIATEALEVYSQRVMLVIERTLASKDRPSDKLTALFDVLAKRVDDGTFLQSCAVGTVSLDLDETLEDLRVVLAISLARWGELIARHFDFGDTRQTKSFAGFVLTAIEGAYIRCRVERSSRPFKEAGVWLAALEESHTTKRLAGKATETGNRS
jgi:TetR/AcrR family transcriptional repressor of lmrAB and yxaGH operons